MADKTKESVYCDFCGKSRDEVKKMIVGNEVAICNECVDLCSNILNKELEVFLFRRIVILYSKKGDLIDVIIIILHIYN